MFFTTIPPKSKAVTVNLYKEKKSFHDVDTRQRRRVLSFQVTRPLRQFPVCVVHLVLGCFPLYRTNRLETTQTILLRKNGTRRNQSYRWIAACVTDKTEPQDLRMRHHWPVHRWHRPFANQVEGKFVGGQNKNPGAASQTLLTGGIDYICDDTQATISQCGWIAFQRFKSCSND